MMPIARALSALASAGAVVVVVVVAGAGCPGRDAGLQLGIDAVAHEAFFPIDEGKHALGFEAFDGAISCDSCHAGASTFKEPSCLGCHEHRAELINGIHGGLSDYRYSSPSCLTCHPTGQAAEISDEQHDEYFPIADGTAHAAVLCADCHLDGAADRANVTCTGCHDGSHDVALMEEQHGTAMRDFGYAWDTVACRECHPRSQNPGLFAHAFFPVEDTDVHNANEATCKDCHATPADRSQLACTGCHTGAHEEGDMQIAHTTPAPVPNYSYQSGACFMCHARAQVPGETEHNFFPIAAGTTHALGSTTVDTPPVTIACTTCHENSDNLADVSCVGCHAHSEEVLAPTHTTLEPLGYQWNDASCLFCHPNGEPTGIVDHDVYFPIAVGTVHAVPPITCVECHASRTDRSLLLCATCHVLDETEPQHRGMPGFAFDSAACLGCHAQAQNPGLFDHEAFFPLAGTVHELKSDSPDPGVAMRCADCHASQTNRLQLSCNTCHQGSHDEAPMQTVHQSIPDYSWSPASCFGCHPDGSAANAVFAHPFFPIADGTTHGAYNCIDCHSVAGDNTQVACIDCHEGAHDAQPMAQRHVLVDGYVHETAQCLFCHPQGEASGLAINHEAYFPLALPAVHNAIACGDCHVNPADRTQVGCAQCHANDATPPATVHTGIPGFVNQSPACLACHPRADPRGLFDHAPYFPIAVGTNHQPIGCSECHASYTDRTQMRCNECHTTLTTPLPPAQAHTNVGGFNANNNNAGCKRCHAEGVADRVAAHTPFRINTGPHNREPCLECHTTSRTDKPWAQDFSRQSCVLCHSVNEMNNKHNGENGYVSYDVPRCTTCHANGRKP